MSDDLLEGPFPSLLPAVLITLAAWFTAGFVITLFGPDPDVTSVGIGEVVGLGLAGTLAARRVPPPQAERLGLRGFRRDFWLPVALLLPAVVVTSEIDNLVAFLAPPAEPIDPVERMRELLEGAPLLAGFELVIVAIGLSPVVEEWLFRGVLQQGLVGQLGRVRGVAVTATLFALGHLAPALPASSTLSLFVASFSVGCLLGLVRLATGSILAPIVLHAGMNALGLGALLFVDPIDGFTAAGGHMSALLLAPSLAAVYMGTRAMLRCAGESPPAGAPDDRPPAAPG